MFRELGAPAVVAQSVAYGDGSGTVHFLSRAKGESQARMTTDGSAITTPPISVAGHAHRRHALGRRVRVPPRLSCACIAPARRQP